MHNLIRFSISTVICFYTFAFGAAFPATAVADRQQNSENRPLSHFRARFMASDLLAARDRLVRIDADMARVQSALADELAQADATDVVVDPALPRRIQVLDVSGEIHRKRREIYDQTLEAIRRRDASAVTELEQELKQIVEPELALVRDSADVGSAIEATVWLRVKETTRSSMRMVGTGFRRERFIERHARASRIRFDLWTDPQNPSVTWALIDASPVENAFELGSRVSWKRLDDLSGVEESKLVDSYREILSRW